MHLENLFSLGALTLRAFWKRRIQFAQIISSDPSMNSNRYVRFMVLAVVEMTCTLPIGIYSIYISTKGVEIGPWISWADTHFQFGYIGQFPAIEWRANTYLVASCYLRFHILRCVWVRSRSQEELCGWFLVGRKSFRLLPTRSR